MLKFGNEGVDDFVRIGNNASQPSKVLNWNTTSGGKADVDYHLPGVDFDHKDALDARGERSYLPLGERPKRNGPESPTRMPRPRASSMAFCEMRAAEPNATMA